MTMSSTKEKIQEKIGNAIIKKIVEHVKGGVDFSYKYDEFVQKGAEFKVGANAAGEKSGGGPEDMKLNFMYKVDEMSMKGFVLSFDIQANQALKMVEKMVKKDEPPKKEDKKGLSFAQAEVNLESEEFSIEIPKIVPEIKTYKKDDIVRALLDAKTWGFDGIIFHHKRFSVVPVCLYESSQSLMIKNSKKVIDGIFTKPYEK